MHYCVIITFVWVSPVYDATPAFFDITIKIFRVSCRQLRRLFNVQVVYSIVVMGAVAV